MKRAAASSALLALLLLAGSRPVTIRLGPGLSKVLESLKRQPMSRTDAETMTRGYYEEADDTFRFNHGLAEIYRGGADGARQPILDTPIARRNDGGLGYELVPSSELVESGIRLHVNRWGMRDRDYPLEKPRGSYRIALLGDSLTMGRGVGDDQTYEARLEAAWNRPGGRPIEILNFSVDGYSDLQQLFMMGDRVGRFAPDCVVLVGHVGSRARTTQMLAQFLTNDFQLPPELAAILQAGGVIDWLRSRDKKAREKDRAQLEELVKPLAPGIQAWIDRALVARIRALSAQPIYLAIPLPGLAWYGDIAEPLRVAREAGFVTVDASHAFDGADSEELVLGDYDRHLNVAGHQRLAEAIDRAFRAAETGVPLP